MKEVVLQSYLQISCLETILHFPIKIMSQVVLIYIAVFIITYLQNTRLINLYSQSMIHFDPKISKERVLESSHWNETWQLNTSKVRTKEKLSGCGFLVEMKCVQVTYNLSVPQIKAA